MPVPPDLVHEVFARQAARTPGAVAVEFDGAEVTYRTLDAHADRFADQLVRRGVRPGAVVGVHLARGVELVVAVLAVLKAGAAYLLLDPDHPRDRLRLAIEDAGVGTVVTGVDWPGVENVRLDIGLLSSGPDAGDRESGPGSLSPAAPACVMFTSGSTGRAKAVLVSHRALLAWLVGQDFFDFSADRVWLQFSPVSWDIFALELFGALLYGARCVLQPGQRPDVATIVRLVTTRRVDSLSFSSGLFAVMVDEHPEMFASVRQVMFGGEPPSVAHVLAARRRFPRLRLVNGYGAVETALLETFHAVGPDDAGRSSIPIGRPAGNARGHVLDERLRPVASGEAGELYAASDAIADGYVGQPGLTAAAFVADPTGAPGGGRMYRTGDLVRLEPDGTWALLGRTDDQVKVRGFRVDLTEIERVLCGHPEVRRAAVVVRTARSDAKRIVAYVVPSGTSVDTPQLTAYVRRLLPGHSVPDDVVPLAALPLRPSGKVDRAALPDPQRTVGSGAGPGDEREQILCKLFADALNLPEIRVDDDFFRLGGDSLIATRLMSQLRKQFGTDLPFSALYDAPTVAKLAPLLTPSVAARPALRRAVDTRS